MTAALPDPPPVAPEVCGICGQPMEVVHPNAPMPLLTDVQHCPRCDRPSPGDAKP
jgi:hypothetical protein